MGLTHVFHSLRIGHGAWSASDYEQLRRETDRLKTGLLEDEGGHRQQEQREEQTINDPGMGPNMSKATGELEEEESAGAALMPQSMRAGGAVWDRFGGRGG